MKKLFIINLTVILLITSTICVFGSDRSEINSNIEKCIKGKDSVHQIAEIARSLGCDESNPIIQEASRMWYEYDSEQNIYINQLVKLNSYESELNQFLTDNVQNAEDMAGVMYAESRGLDCREMSMVCWCILNRYDTQRYGKTLHEVIWAKSQFAHSSRTVADNGTDLVWLANDVLTRWFREQKGETEVGRTLPQGYCFYYGNGRHNLFRMKNSGTGSYNFGLWNPYE